MGINTIQCYIVTFNTTRHCVTHCYVAGLVGLSVALQVFGLLTRFYSVNLDFNVSHRVEDLGFYQHHDFFNDLKGDRCLQSIFPASGSQIYRQKVKTIAIASNRYASRNFAVYLLSCGDILSNPGPARFQCGYCEKPVRKNQKGILCDKCEFWYHIKCINMAVDEYDRLSHCDDEWLCNRCDTPPPSPESTDSDGSAHNTTLLSAHSTSALADNIGPDMNRVNSVSFPTDTIFNNPTNHTTTEIPLTRHNDNPEAVTSEGEVAPERVASKSKTSGLSDSNVHDEDTSFDLFQDLMNVRKRHPDKLLCAYLNINSMRYKFDHISTVRKRIGIKQLLCYKCIS